MNETAKAELERILKWGAPRELQTKRGAKVIRKAKPTDDFWAVWRNADAKRQLQAVGISVGKNDYGDGDWEVCWWQDIDPTVMAERKVAIESSRATDADIEIPCPPGLSYMPFQRAGVRYGLQRFNSNGTSEIKGGGVLIGDEMGLGKTIQAIGLLNCIPNLQRALVITKAPLKLNWWREVRKWLVDKSLTVGIAESKCFPTTNIVICNYDIAWRIEKRLHEVHWDAVILDESHKCKSKKSKTARAIVGYKPKRDEDPRLASSGTPARYRIALTGTPIENCVEEMWPVLWWLDRERFPSVWTLLKLAGSKYVHGVGQSAPTEAGKQALQDFLRVNIMIRRLKKDVLQELPPKTRSLVEFSTEGLEHLIRQENELWEQDEEERTKAHAAMVIAKATDDAEGYRRAVEKLKEIQGISFAEMARIRKETAIAKVPQTVEFLREMIEENGNAKILVFAHHTEALERLHAEFRNSVLIHGQHNQSQRDDRVHRFQTDAECGPFFGSIRATGEGLTLTAANRVVFHESDWVWSRMVQSEDRAHRIGQKDNVTVQVCVVPGTIDAKMVKTCMDKADLADKALDAMTRTELMEEPAVPPPVDWKPLATKREVENHALLVTPEQSRAVSECLGMLAGMCDGARKIDGAGFSKMDAAIGRELAQRGNLSPKQVVLGARLVTRYRRQLPLQLVETAIGKALEQASKE